MRERIIEEAKEQFLQFGIRNITMDQIAAELGISKRTLYGLFKDKTELIFSCVDALFMRHNLKTTEIMESSQNVIEAFFNSLREGMKVMNTVNPVFYYDLKKFYPKIWKASHERKMSSSLRFMEDLLKKGISQGLFREEIDVHIISKLFYEQTKLIIDEQVFPRNEFSISEVFKNLTVNFMRGISTHTGINVIDEMMIREKLKTDK